MNIPLPALLVICGALIVAVLVLALPAPRSWSRARTPSDRRRNGPIYRDDDRYWYGSLFYNNPDDPEPFVPKRYGFGWTVNFGHPVGKVVLIATVLLGLVLPLVVAILGVLSPGLFHPYGCHPSGCYWGQ